MPFSSYTGKDATIGWFRSHEQTITRILDIGVGSGTYIECIKEKAKVCEAAEWIGIEVWEPYIKQYNLDERYDIILNQDVRTINWGNMGKFSVALAGDILEHMTKNEAIALVENVLNIAEVLVISIPIIYYPQEEYEGNPYEEHIKPDWSHDEVVATWGHQITEMAVMPGADVGVYLLRKTR